uniref:Uncharacterized protein n=1 Tax=Anguilla anguilla TaxID=7936 RepID=A0A0E9VEA6_ANGAN
MVNEEWYIQVIVNQGLNKLQALMVKLQSLHGFTAWEKAAYFSYTRFLGFA